MKKLLILLLAVFLLVGCAGTQGETPPVADSTSQPETVPPPETVSQPNTVSTQPLDIVASITTLPRDVPSNTEMFLKICVI